MNRNSTQRFSDRVDNYVRYRPSYPAALLETLRQRARLTAGSAIADIGSGTGIFTALLLPLAGRVFAVEPNAEMRAAAEQQFGAQPGFVSVAGSAEATTLPDRSLDFIAVAQAFHWFEPVACRREFARVLSPGGQVALIWNERRKDTPFLIEYENLLQQQAAEYDQVKHSRIDEVAIAAFFRPARYELSEEPNEQQFDLAGLEGRTLSSSYIPNVGQPGHEDFMAKLRAIFARHATNGRVSFLYVTKLFFGALPPLK